jgi:2-polyprenyl-6-methoxyphenol hydroxylase-like FAD-dependent oxidoreductase
MRRIAVIGSGTSGMLFAHKMRAAGYEITVYSDRTAEQWLHASPPSGTAFLYDCNIQIERDLHLEHWEAWTFHGEGIHFDWQPTTGAGRLVAAGLFASPRGGAVDLRMRVHRWMHDFERAGGRIVVGGVTPDGLDRISREHDLTVLAVGKGDLARIIPRDPERSVYDKPQRNLCMCIVDGIEGSVCGDRATFVPVKFNFFADAGEYFWVPYTHKSGRPTWCAVFEPRPDSYLDRFHACHNAGEVVEVARQLIAEHAPYEWEFVRNMRPLADDPHSWLKGRFPPTVRKSCGRTPSGGLVIPLGDVAVLFDPIGGQGGNCAQKNAWWTAERIIEHGDRPYDEAWAEAVNSGFWQWHAKAAYAFNNVLLEPMTEAGRIVMETSARSFEFASRHFFGNIDKPNNYSPWLFDAAAAAAFTAPYRTGQPG